LVWRRSTEAEHIVISLRLCWWKRLHSPDLTSIRVHSSIEDWLAAFFSPFLVDTVNGNSWSALLVPALDETPIAAGFADDEAFEARGSSPCSFAMAEPALWSSHTEISSIWSQIGSHPPYVGKPSPLFPLSLRSGPYPSSPCQPSFFSILYVEVWTQTLMPADLRLRSLGVPPPVTPRAPSAPL